MTDNIIVSKRNESTLLLDCENSILRELAENFTFFVEGYKHMPKFKAGVWNGQICLLDLRFGTLPIGLYEQFKIEAKELGYEVEAKPNQFGSPEDTDIVTREGLIEFTDSLNLHSNGNKIEIRDYQLDALFDCIKYQKRLIESPTGSGKSLLIHTLMQWYRSKGFGKILLIVPTLNLLNQMKADLIDYTSEYDFNVENEIQLMGDGASKVVTKDIVISTWQTLIRIPADQMDFDVVIGDEIHQFKNDIMKNLFERSTSAKYKFGVSGSLGKSETNRMVLRGMIGEITKVRTTRELIDDGRLSDIKIKCVLLKYGKETKKLFKQTAIANNVSKVDYPTEVNFLCDHKKRNNFIRNLALMQKGVTLVLFNRVEDHGVPLYESIKSKSDGQEVYFISGDVNATERERIRLVCQESDKDVILVASSGTTATGTNIPRINNIIFAAPTKSVIRTLQSIGRGLRKSEGKTHLNLYDIVDVIGTGKTTSNFAYKHFTERLSIYQSEEFDYKLLEVELEK